MMPFSTKVCSVRYTVTLSNFSPALFSISPWANAPGWLRKRLSIFSLLPVTLRLFRFNMSLISVCIELNRSYNNLLFQKFFYVRNHGFHFIFFQSVIYFFPDIPLFVHQCP